MESVKKCGCKGIRTCLICEKDGTLSKIEDESKKTNQYEYCPGCDLCWPLDSDAGEGPLYLGKLTIVPDFVTVEEEKEIVAAIDSMQWMPSQSGRRKQDFGPKVNFKKKKSKIGDFKGFPRFTESLVKRLEQCDALSDFCPVELCHLDYDPGRGSAIEPHIDDTWIWGERLVTLNLVSLTVLTLTPANAEATCDCQDQCLNMSTGSINENKFCSKSNPLVPANVELACDCQAQCLNTITGSCNDNKHCNHNIPLECSFRESSLDFMDSNPVKEECATYRIGLNSLKVPLGCQSKCLRTCASNADSVEENNHCNHNYPSPCPLHKDSLSQIDSNPVEITGQKNTNLICDYQTECSRTHVGSTNERKLYNNKVPVSCPHERSLNSLDCIAVEDMCTTYRIGHKGRRIEVLVPSPPRSLVVVAGCSRHHWFHEIKRNDIVSRRLAMTFRELSRNFMSGGSDEIVGNELLELGRTFVEMKV